MPNQHAATRQAVTFRLPADLIADAKLYVASRGETMTAFVERLLRSEVPITTPPPAAEGQPDQ